jgi:hypothetical protein
VIFYPRKTDDVFNLPETKDVEVRNSVNFFAARVWIVDDFLGIEDDSMLSVVSSLH